MLPNTPDIQSHIKQSIISQIYIEIIASIEKKCKNFFFCTNVIFSKNYKDIIYD
jgi:hypothetical protein